MRRLWQRMAEIYGHRWTSGYGVDAAGEAGATWAKGLAGLLPAQIAHGLESTLSASDDWPPTLPRFRALCMGVPSFAAVRTELDRGERSRFGMLVWANLDTYRYRMCDADKSDRILRDAYELAREHVLRGGTLPDLPVAAIAASEETKRPRASEETVRAACADLEKLFGSSA